MSFLRPLTRNFSVHSPKSLLLRTGRSACCVSLYLSLWHLPWNISPQNKNRWSLYLKSPTRAEHEMSKIPINCVLFLKTRAPFMLNKQANISNNRAIAHNVKGERETFRKGVCDLPGLQKALQQCPIVPLLDPPSLSQPLNEWSNRSPACCRKSPKCFFPMQTTFTAALNLHKLSHCPAQQQCNTVQCNSSVAGKGIWVTGFL